MKSLDQALESNGLRPQKVPGEGDCQYWAAMASAKTQGIDLGGAGDLRLKVYHTLTQWPETYSPFVDWMGYGESVCTTLLLTVRPRTLRCHGATTQ